MKKTIIAGVAVITCIALYAAVWSKNTEVGNLPAEPSIPAINAEIEARSEEIPQILLSAVTSAPELALVTESEPEEMEITAEEKTETAQPTEPMPRTVSKSASASFEPKAGDKTVIDGKPYVWIPGYGWIEDEGGGSVGTMVGNPGDQLTGNNVGIIGGGTTVHGKGDINKQVGIMGGGVAQAHERRPGVLVEGHPARADLLS